MKKHNENDLVDCMLSYSEQTKFTMLAPFTIRPERTLQQQLEIYLKQGITRLDIDGEMVLIEDLLADEARLQQTRAEDLYLLIDRLVVSREKATLTRLRESAETAFFEGNGECLLRFYPSRVLHRFSIRFEADGMTFEEPSGSRMS